MRNRGLKRDMVAVMAVGAMLLSGCSGVKASETAAVSAQSETVQLAATESAGETQAAEKELVHIPELKIAFSPYQDSDSIMIATKPLEDLLKGQLEQRGYEVDQVSMSVGTSYEAVGEALSAGSADMGFISGGTYTLFDDDCEVLLTALRKAINKDSENPADWNDGTIEQETTDMSNYYRSILLAGPSEKGQELIAKVNAGEELTWEDLDSASWAVMGPSSASGYIYPSLWLQSRYGKGISDLTNAVKSDSYTTSLARLATGQADIMVSYGHIRIKNAPKWQDTLGGTGDMAVQTGVIGVTEPIMNDTISVSRNSSIMDDDFKKALGESMIEIGETEEGKKIIDTFSQKGYRWANDSDYDGEREAQKLLKSLQ